MRPSYLFYSFWTKRYQWRLGGSQKPHIHPSVTRSFPPQASTSGEPERLPSPAVRRQQHSFSCLSGVKGSQPKEKVSIKIQSLIVPKTSRFQLKIVHHIKNQENLKLNKKTINGCQHQDVKDVRII